tara:strand:+ start:81319 stop:81765 length:447 start_codon:yes stop_codon:yes gene_type:complete
MRKIVTWVIVADHQHAQVFNHDGPGHGIRRVEGMTFETHLERSHDLMTDRPGRKAGVGGAMRSMTPASDPHRAAGEKFIAGISVEIAKAATRKAFERLVLVAPPRALGEFRKALPDRVRKMVTAEIDEDLTKADESDLADRLADVLPI